MSDRLKTRVGMKSLYADAARRLATAMDGHLRGAEEAAAVERQHAERDGFTTGADAHARELADRLRRCIEIMEAPFPAGRHSNDGDGS